MITEQTKDCVIRGARLFKLLSQGQITKGEALIELKRLSPDATVEEAEALLKRVNELVYS